MKALRVGKSEINPYTGTNEAEFFAVVRQYFFKQPHQLQIHHPELYALLTGLFLPKPQRPPGPQRRPAPVAASTARPSQVRPPLALLLR